jgi:hypothetical protein
MRRPAGFTPLACSLLLAASFAPPARAADEGAGTRAAGFLTAGSSPSVLAMGGAGLALGRDVQAVLDNPAALAWLGGTQVAFSRADFADQTSQEWLGLGGRLGASRTRVGFALRLRDEGTIVGRDATGLATGDAHAQDLALTMQLARTLGPHLAAGGAAHYVRQSIADASGSGFAFDAGAQLRVGTLAFALAAQDFGGGMRWDSQRWRMPAALGAGVALEPARTGLRLALDWSAPAGYYRNVRTGVEWRWRDRLALRTGWRQELGAPATDRLGGPTFGLGARAGAWWFDYGYVLSNEGAATHRVGLSLRGGAPGEPGPAAPARPVGPAPEDPSPKR